MAMWAVKKKIPGATPAPGSMNQKKKMDFGGVDDIDALLAESKKADEQEAQAKKEQEASNSRGRCGC